MDTREWPTAVSNPAAPTNGKPASKPPVSLTTGAIAITGLLAIPSGLIGWIWSADWRWAATGFLAALAVFLVAWLLSVLMSEKHRDGSPGKAS